MKALLMTIFAFAISALYCIWEAWALSLLWLWFVVPTFHLQALSIGAAVGVALVAGFLTHQINHKDIMEKRSLAESLSRLGLITARPAMYLLIGWIAKQWVAA